MQITINIPDIQQALLILQMLKAVPNATVAVQEIPLTSTLKKDVTSLFGAISPKMTMEEIDKRLQEQKEEWL